MNLYAFVSPCVNMCVWEGGWEGVCECEWAGGCGGGGLPPQTFSRPRHKVIAGRDLQSGKISGLAAAFMRGTPRQATGSTSSCGDGGGRE